MKQALAENTEIILCETGTDKQFCFKILNIIGMGASCIVYTASYTDAEGNTFTVLLKEFYPSGLEITRNSAMELVVPDKYNDNFEKYMQRFTDGYRRQLKFRQNPESMNSISNIQGIFEGNNTKYTAMTCQNGISIDEADLSLYDIFRVLKAVTVQIDNFHKNNFLYLDLKPENVILYPETPELVMLFDFDSAVENHELSRENLSFTHKWSAPETVQKKMKNIDVRSDVYTLGALLMYMLLERNPELTDRRRNADWTDEFQNSLLADESPETKRMIADIFRKTLSANPDSRYSSCSELLEVIEPFIQSFQKQKPYLKTVLPIGNNYFCGRDREISEIHNILESETSFLFLHGIGGIGKSELAKHYAIKYSDSYDAVIFVRYNGSIIETVASDSGFPVVNCNRCDDESDEEYFKRKISILQKICTPRHLVILDNFDTDECDNLDELTSLNCKFLITSRVDFEGIFPQYKVDVLDEFEDIYNIFSYWYRNEIPENEKQSAEDIITALQGHTMAVELVSKQMFLNDIKPVEMYKKLAENGMYRSSSGKIKEFKDGRLRNETAYSHIETLFNIFELNETEKYVLSNLALIGPTLITLDYLDEICKWNADQKSALNTMITGGWVQKIQLDEYSCTTLHPLISEVLCNQLKPDCNVCETLVINSAVIADNIDDTGNADERKATVQWLGHLAENIHGKSPELALFYDKMIYPVYLGEDNYKKALWCIEKGLDILDDTEPDEVEKRLNLYLFGSTIAAKADSAELSEMYNQKLENIKKDSEGLRLYHQAILMQAIDNNDCETANHEAETLLQLALEENDDYIISQAYGKLVWVRQTFDNDDESIVKYSESGLFHIQKYLNENDFSDDKHRLSELYDETAEFCRDAHKYEDAAEYYFKSLELINEIYVEESVRTIPVYLNLGVCMFYLADFEKSSEYTEKAANSAVQLYGENHPETEDILCMCYSTFKAIWLATGDERYAEFAEDLSYEH